ncbi:RING-H2 finger protein ATL74-like [Andrographis paniculata]|uniref:RING-H2 finger protein ATL74-like n=1 Tax=Andrographis paniculata TaxID=175694 RepID=UPI0021E72378|nr:RING-H2 finger protein ATL74-like [Andrographis paniculata]
MYISVRKMGPESRPARLLLDSDMMLAGSPLNANRTVGGYDRDANFDSNMVIILAALLCAMVCALALNSIVRCALRCRRTYAYDDHRPPRPPPTIKKAAPPPPIPYKSGADDIPATECPICLGEFVDGENVRIFPGCGHGFHAPCIDKWLVLHSSCPNCRQPLNTHDDVRVQID